MNKEVKEKWVAALRSGEYKQGFGSLHRKDSYCCLGVLCKISGLEEKEYNPGSEIKSFVFAGETEDEILPEPFRVSLGIDSDVQQKLYQLNDGFGYEHVSYESFPEIADYIEQNL